MSKLLSLSAGIALAIAASAAHAAPLVYDGDFSAAVLPNGDTKDQLTVSNTYSTGWSVNRNALTYINKPGSADNGTYLSVYSGFPDHDTAGGNGGNFIMADGDPGYSSTLYQMISGLTVGQSYLLTFDFAGSEQAGFKSASGFTTEWWNVSLDTSVLASAPTAYGTQQANVQKSALLTTPNGSYSPWQTASMTFTATSASEFLSFLAGGTPTGAPPIAFLDNVSLVSTAQTAVPEPMTLSLLGVGLVGAVVARRRARRTAVQA